MYYSRNYFLVDVTGRRRRFGTTIKASPDTIAEIVAARNIGEVPEREDPILCKRFSERMPLADRIETKGFTAESLHMACFVGFLALKSEVASVEEIMGDVGLVHEIAHNLDCGEGAACIATRAEVVEMARRIARAIPGYPYR